MKRRGFTTEHTEHTEKKRTEKKQKFNAGPLLQHGSEGGVHGADIGKAILGLSGQRPADYSGERAAERWVGRAGRSGIGSSWRMRVSRSIIELARS